MNTLGKLQTCIISKISYKWTFHISCSFISTTIRNGN